MGREKGVRSQMQVRGPGFFLPRARLWARSRGAFAGGMGDYPRDGEAFSNCEAGGEIRWDLTGFGWRRKRLALVAVGIMKIRPVIEATDRTRKGPPDFALNTNAEKKRGLKILGPIAYVSEERLRLALILDQSIHGAKHSRWTLAGKALSGAYSGAGSGAAGRARPNQKPTVGGWGRRKTRVQVFGIPKTGVLKRNTHPGGNPAGRCRARQMEWRTQNAACADSRGPDRFGVPNISAKDGNFL